jgi:hemoglobin
MRKKSVSRLLPRGRAAGLVLVGIIALVLACATPSRAGDAGLYDELGGKEGLTRIVNYAIDNYVADPRISGEFDNINFDWLKGRLVLQFCQLTGGPCKYPGRDMVATHKGLHIDSAEFNALVEDLEQAMDKEGVPFRTQNRFLAILAPMKKQIVTR